MKKLFCVLCILFPIVFILSCKQITETTEEITQVNYIVPVWKGSLPTAPSNPEVGWAYYNTTVKKSFVYDGSEWQIMAQDGTDGTGITWKGELSSAPSNPKINWAYYNTIDGNSYIYNGTSWDFLAKSGRDGSSGILLWLGSYDFVPENPSDGWAYYNTNDGVSYIYSNGSWQILSKDGNGIIWKGVLSVAPESPELNWAYYDTTNQTSYIWNGMNWDTLSVSLGGDTTVTVGITWLGTFNSAPLSPLIGYAYYNSTAGASYIYDGSVWQQISKDGANGTNGTSTAVTGYLITWKGSYSSAPTNPKAGWAYYNTSAKKSYIYDGSSWQIMAQDGTDGKDDSSEGGNSSAVANGYCYLYVLINVDGNSYTHYNTQTFSEVDFGTVGLQSTLKTTTFYLMLQSSTKISFELTGNPAIQISGVDADSFVITQPSITEVQSGSYIMDAAISFTPTSLGEKSATITIPNNSPDYPDFSFTVKGTGSYWPKTFDGGEGDGNDKITCAVHDSQGNLYFMGYGFELVNHHSGYDWWIKKFNSEGVEITNGWNKKLDHVDDYQYSSYPKDTELITNAIIDSNDNLIVASSTNTVKFNSSGTQLWEFAYGGTLSCDSQDNIYIVTSSSTTKISSNGSILYTLPVGGKLDFDNNDGFVISNGDTIYYYSTDGIENWSKICGDFSTLSYNYEVEGYIGKGTSDYYYVPVENGNKYLVGLNTASYGDGTKTLSSSNDVSAVYETGDSIFSSTSIYATSTKTFIANQTGNAIVKIAGWSSSYTGTYGLLIVNNITSGSEISSLSWKTATITTKGEKVTDTFSVEQGCYYVFALDDSAHSGGNYSYDAKISAEWTDTGTSIFSTQDNAWSSVKLLYAPRSGEVTVTVQGYSSTTTGACAYAVQKLTPVYGIRLFKPMTVNDIAFDNTNNLYVVGGQNCTIDAYSKTDARIKKIDVSGNEITNGWNKTFDWGHCDDESATDIFFDGSKLIVFGTGNDLLSGSSASDSWIKYFTISGSESASYVISNPISKVVDFNSQYYWLDCGKDDSSYYHYLHVYDSSFNLMKTCNAGTNGSMIVSEPLFVHNTDGALYGAGYNSNLVTSKSGYDWYIVKY